MNQRRDLGAEQFDGPQRIGLRNAGQIHLEALPVVPQVPVLVLLLILAPSFVPESKDPTPGRVDVVSIGLSLVTMTPIVYAIKSIAHDGFTSLS